jgi:hypothetical protein
MIFKIAKENPSFFERRIMSTVLNIAAQLFVQGIKVVPVFNC